MENEKGMSLIVKTITRLTVRLIFLFGIYIVLHGHISPGGGFAGGVMLALSLIHVMLAYGKDEALKELTFSGAQRTEGIGGILFLSVALIGILFGFFFKNFLGAGEPFSIMSAGTMVINNIAIGLKVLGGLFAIFIAVNFFRKER